MTPLKGILPAHAAKSLLLMQDFQKLTLDVQPRLARIQKLKKMEEQIPEALRIVADFLPLAEQAKELLEKMGSSDR